MIDSKKLYFINLRNRKNKMGSLLQCIVALGLLIALFSFIGFLLIQVAKLKSKSIINQINSGKMSDAKLTRQYNNFKKWKDNKLIAILMAGIAFKLYIKMQNMLFDAYKEGMIKRNLPL
ncbi:hypothetical protein [uncultured Gilliamella sp.]|uniref:hypothetical protein n=1 Tax=uncultured Gilliamella sp. TaxID=1193505 RepID=UPI0025EB3EBA|nr:hypothetical protein [uncultured Gilliamella sp.]